MTVENVPTAQDFLEEAKRTLNLAADLVLGFLVERDQAFGHVDHEDQTAQEHHNLSQYIFRNAINILFLAAEQALKSRICQTSPYLLLDGPRSWPNPKQHPLSFGSFRTINATDLPKAIALFCAEPLSEKGIEIFETLRVMRNETSHNYSGNSNIDIINLLELMFMISTNLLECDSFFPMRLRHLNSSEASTTHPDHTTNEAAYEFEVLQRFLGIDRMHAWLGVPKSKLVICGTCAWEGTDWEDQPATAVLGENCTVCYLCGQTTKVVSRQCWSCEKPTLSSRESGYCIECGRPGDAI